MSATICRLMLSLAVVAGSAVIYFIVFVVLIEGIFSRQSDEIALWMSNAITLTFLVGAWVMIWRGEVRMTPHRIGMTAGLLLLCVALMLATYTLLSLVTRQEEIGILMGGMTFAFAWLVGSTLAWRETTSERAERLRGMGLKTIACPSCGYNLTGLREATCPECGARYTLEELLLASIESRSGVA